MPQPEDVTSIPPKDRWNLLSMMQANPAWALFCEEHDRAVEKIEKRIFDTKTPDAETRELRLLREQLTDSHDPRKILGKMIVTARKETEAISTK